MIVLRGRGSPLVGSALYVLLFVNRKAGNVGVDSGRCIVWVDSGDLIPLGSRNGRLAIGLGEMKISG